MALTRPKFSQINTTVSSITDPIILLNKNATEANIDVGFIMNRNGTVANVALFWDETANCFVTAFTTDAGVVNSNVAIQGYANLEIGHLTVHGNVLPSANVVYDLGSNNSRFNKLWLAGSTIVMGSETVSVDNGVWSFSTGGSTISLGSTATFIQPDARFTDLYTTNFSTGNALVTGGYADNFPIGANTAATGKFSNAILQSGYADNFIIGANTASSGTFTALTVNGESIFNGNVSINANLFVNGTTTTLHSNNITVDDTILYLAQGNPSNTYDIGVVGAFTEGQYQHTGIYRNHTNGTWTFFSNVTTEPDGNVIAVDSDTVYDKVKLGSLLVSNSTASSSTTTGALIVTGGAGIAGAVYAGSLYDNGSRSLTTATSFSGSSGDLSFSGSHNSLVGTLNTVNTNTGVYGGAGGGSPSSSLVNESYNEYDNSTTTLTVHYATTGSAGYSTAIAVTAGQIISFINDSNSAEYRGIVSSVTVATGADERVEYLFSGAAPGYTLPGSYISNISTIGIIGNEVGASIPQLTVNGKGLVTTVGNISLSSVAVTKASNTTEITANATVGDVGFNLTATGVSAGTYGVHGLSSIAVDTKGRITSASNVSLSTYAVTKASNTTEITANATVGDVGFNLTATGVSAGTYGNIVPGYTEIPVFIVDSKGRITDASSTPVSSAAVVGLYGGADITTTSHIGNVSIGLSDINIAPGTWGAPSLMQITVDSKGRISHATNVMLSTYAVTGLSSSGAGNLTLSAANGPITIDLTPTGPGPQTFGNAGYFTTFTTDTYGRVSSVQTYPAPQAGADGTTGQLQYNNSGLVAGANIVFDSTNGNLVISSVTSSSSTSTGALVVAGGVGIAGSVYAGNMYDNGTRVMSNVVVTGTSGSGYFTGATGLTLGGSLGVTVGVSGTAITIATPQDIQTAASPTFAGLTSTGVIKSSGNVVAGATTETNDTTTGALVSRGGIAAAGNIIAGGNLRSNSYFVGIGYDAGVSAQSNAAVAIGAGAGRSSQGQYSVAIGRNAGNGTQGAQAIAIGKDAGSTSQGGSAVAIGNLAGSNTQSAGGVAIGFVAGQTAQGASSVAIGDQAANNTQGASAVAIGANAGETTQGDYAVSIGSLAGKTSQATGAVAIGKGAGWSSQDYNSVAVGVDAGSSNQGYNSVAIGTNSGKTSQGDTTIAIGVDAGTSSQGFESLAIGVSAGSTSQGLRAVAIGKGAGYTNQGNDAIAIGGQAGYSFQASNSIVLNASGSSIDGANSGLYISPIRDLDVTGDVLTLNRTTHEVTASNVISITGNVDSGGMNSTGLVRLTNTTNAIPYVMGSGAVYIAGGMSIAQDIWVGGNLYVANVVSQNTTTLEVSTPLVYLESSSVYPYSYDIGSYSHFKGGTANVYQHTGLVRSYSGNYWGFFSNVKAEPSLTGTVDWADSTIIWDQIKAGDIVSANTTTSISSTTGALRVSGGAGIAGNIYAGGGINSAAGLYATGAYNGGYTGDGIVIEHSNSFAIPGTRFSGGTTDGYGFYNAGVGGTELFRIDGSTGNIVIPATTTSTSTTTGAFVLKGGAGIAGNIRVGGLTHHGTGTFTKAVTGGGEVTFDNGTTDTPGLTFYYANNTNLGIDVASNSLRFVSNLNETGGTLLGTFSDVGVLNVGFRNYATAIANGGTSGTGNIGAPGAIFNTVHAVATSAKYADLAEKYTADAEYKPGTVVVFGGTDEITTTTITHDTRVAGIVSTEPAYLMNSYADGTPVALTGRVPCLVQGPVNKGDVLVTSETPGVAQRIVNSLYVPGCVIGKSLEVIETNEIKTIEVVVGRF